MTIYEEILREINQISKSMPHLQHYYRGHSNKTWALTPTICRDKTSPPSEHNIINSAINAGWWNSSASLFENIAYLRHMGKQMRFLDYTTNPDIAIYFACCDHTDIDGEIIICQYDQRDFSCQDSNIIAELSLLTSETSMRDFTNSLLKKHPGLQRKYAMWEELGSSILVWLDHGFMATPTEDERNRLKDWNPRLYDQSGAFFVPGNKTKSPYRSASTTEARSCIILPEIAEVPSIITHWDYTKKIAIKKEHKAYLLRELAQKGIDRRFIYPDEKTGDSHV